MAISRSKIPLSFNIVVIGDRHVGKSEMIEKYLGHFFTKSDSHSTDSFNKSFIKNTSYDGVEYTLYIWEWDSTNFESATDGSTRNNVTLDPAVLRGADCFLLCYAMNSANSFKNIDSKWIPIIKKIAPKTPIILVGTKLDLKHCYGSTRVSDLNVQRMKYKTKAVSVLECSSRTLEGIPQVFKEAVMAGSQNQQLGCLII